MGAYTLREAVEYLAKISWACRYCGREIVRNSDHSKGCMFYKKAGEE